MSEEIDRWVAYMKAHPSSWRKEHSAFVDAQFAKHEAFLKRLLSQPGGREKVVSLYGIKNTAGYRGLLGR